MKILSAEEIREWDKFTIAYEPISSIDLMERAAGECTNFLIGRGLTKNPIRIFCGKGNNGGDGLAIARQLFEKGIVSEVFILELGTLGTEDFNTNLSRLSSLPIQIRFLEQADFFPIINSNETVIDCLFGSGLNRPLEGLSAALVEHINNTNATIVSIDLPSGMFADKSTMTNPIIKATYTLTFQTLKLCFVFPENEEYSGEVHILDIGLHPQYLSTVNATYELVDIELIKQLYKPRKKFSHKGTFGHSLIVAGEKGKMGASASITIGLSKLESTSFIKEPACSLVPIPGPMPIEEYFDHSVNVISSWGDAMASGTAI